MDGAASAGARLLAYVRNEHVASSEILDELAFPRLDAIAERAWTREVCSDIAARSTSHPRFA